MIIYGASGHGLVVLDILKRNGIVKWQFVDDTIKTLWVGGDVVSPQKILVNKEQPAIIAIGDNHARKLIAQIHQFFYIKAIHPSSILAIPQSNIGIGTAIMPGVIINSEVNIGIHAILNTSCSIDHECIIGDYVHVSPNATLCGKVIVGEGAHIGAGAVVIQGIKIGKWAIVGAGAVVVKDVPDFATVIGNPAKVIKIVKLEDR